MYEIFEQLLQKYDVTSYKVAKEAGVTQTALSNWKTGKSTPTTKTLQRIADYFGVTIDYLMTGEEKENDKYYVNEETAEMAQTLFKNRPLRVLFDAAKDATPEDLETTYNMLMALKKKERGNNVDQLPSYFNGHDRK